MCPFVDEKGCHVLTSVQLLGDGAFHYGKILSSKYLN